MNLKQALLAALEADQLKALCAELELEVDRRSNDAMITALSRSKRSKPQRLIGKLTVAQLRAVLDQIEQPTDGRKEELVQRVLEAGGRAKPPPQATTPAAGGYQPGNPATVSPETRSSKASTSDSAAEYRHLDQA